MQIENLNSLSILIFTMICLWSIFLFGYNYCRRERLRKVYRLLFNQNRFFYIRYLCLVMSLIIISLSIFRVSYYDNSSLESEKSIDIVFVLDVSKSMNTIDIQNASYSRLTYAKNIMTEYVSSHPENRYGLIVFAWDGISISPLSNNINGFLTNLTQVDYTNVAQQWTNLEQALELGYTRFGISEDNSWKTLILISDWWDDNDILDSELLDDINSDSIPSFVFWVWTKLGWPIPIGRDRFGNILYQNFEWFRVVTRLNKKLLKNLADSIWWEYNNLENFGSQLNSIKSQAQKKANEKYKKDISGWLAIFATIFFILYLLFPYLYKWEK